MTEIMNGSSWTQVPETGAKDYGSTDLVFSVGSRQPTLQERIKKLEEQQANSFMPTAAKEVKFLAGYEDSRPTDDRSSQKNTSPRNSAVNGERNKTILFKHLHQPIEDTDSGNTILHGERIDSEDGKYRIRTSSNGAAVMVLATGTEKSNEATQLVGSALYTRQDKKHKDTIFYAQLSSNSSHVRSLLKQNGYSRLKPGERMFVKIDDEFLQNLASDSETPEPNGSTASSQEDDLRLAEQAEIARRQVSQKVDPAIPMPEYPQETIDAVDNKTDLGAVEASFGGDQLESDSQDQPKGKVELGKLAARRAMTRFNKLSKKSKVAVGAVAVAIITAGAWNGTTAAENIFGSSNENKELSEKIAAEPVELEVSSISGQLDLYIPTENGFVKSPFIDTTIDRLNEKVESSVEITPDNLYQVLESTNPDLVKPDYLAVGKSGVEVSLDTPNNKLIKDIDDKTGTVKVDLGKLDVTINTTVSSDGENMKLAPSIVQDGGYGDISAEDMSAYADTLQKDKTELRNSAAKFVESEISDSIITANSGEDLDKVIRGELSKRIEQETGYSKIKFQGEYTAEIHEDDQVVADKENVLQGVSSLRLKNGEEGIKIIHNDDKSTEKEESK